MGCYEADAIFKTKAFDRSCCRCRPYLDSKAMPQLCEGGPKHDTEAFLLLQAGMRKQTSDYHGCSLSQVDLTNIMINMAQTPGRPR